MASSHGIDGDEGAGELFGLGEVIEKIRDRGDLVGLFRHRELSQREPCVGRVGTERMEGFEAFAAIMGAT
jgi:hypothetical protein